MSFPDGSVRPRREPHQPRRLDDFLVTQPQRRLPQDRTHTHTGQFDVGDSRPRDALQAPPAAQTYPDASAAILSALRELTEDNRRIKEDNLQNNPIDPGKQCHYYPMQMYRCRQWQQKVEMSRFKVTPQSKLIT